MYAKRFRLDPLGNLHADRLFCRVFAQDPALAAAAARHMRKRRLDARADKARALMAFEATWANGEVDTALTIAREVHALMLAQRQANDARRSHPKRRPGPKLGHSHAQEASRC